MKCMVFKNMKLIIRNADYPHKWFEGQYIILKRKIKQKDECIIRINMCEYSCSNRLFGRVHLECKKWSI